MDGTLVDGLEPEVDPKRPMQIVVETPYGVVRSSIMPASAAAEIKATLEGAIARVHHFTVTCDDGPVLIPGNTLRESIVRFVYCDGKRSGSATA